MDGMRWAVLGIVWAVAACGDDGQGRPGESGAVTTLTAGVPTTSASGTEGTGSDDGSGTSATTGDPSGSGPIFDVGNPSTDVPPAGECETSLQVTLRDFQSSHPDMESTIAVDPGIVENDLGADGLPVYAGGTAGTTHGQAAFDQWYRDVAGVNQTVPFTLELAPQADGALGYDTAAFFPLDDQAFGNEGNSHNYHFTLELHTSFTYEGGEVFTFRGDDDVFLFINGRLGIDLGGVHGPMEATIDMDAMAGQLGITVGQTYPLDFFFAERHTSESNFRIETSIGCFQPPVG